DVFREPGEDNHFRHVSTFGGHPAACAVALKNIEIIERDKLVNRVEQLGNEILGELKECENHPNVGEVRRIGFLAAFEMVYCKEQGLIIGKNGDTVPGQNNVLIVAPPFITSEDDLHFIVQTIKDGLNEI